MIRTILRKATRRPNEPLNILSGPAHERYDRNLCLTGHIFWGYRAGNIKDWNVKYGEYPPNFHELDRAKGPLQIPADVDFDLALIHHVFGFYQEVMPIAHRLGLPTVRIEHTQPYQTWPAAQLIHLRQFSCDINVFITDYSRKAWLFDETNSEVIEHGIDSEFFKPGPDDLERKLHVLTVANDYINRDVPLGFSLYGPITQGLPVRRVGDTPGFSLPAPSLDALADEYRHAAVFLNTSQISPIPMSTLEAASSGCAIVSTKTCALPDVFTHGENALLSNDPAELRQFCIDLLGDDHLRRKLGRAARELVLKRFRLDRLVQDWNKVFRRVAEIRK